MLNPDHRHAFAPNGDLLVPYNGPRPCEFQQRLLFALQRAMRDEEAALLAGVAVTAVEDHPVEAKKLLTTFEEHLQRCQACGRYSIDLSLVD